MGLDMYLTKKTYIGAQYEHRNVTGKIEISIDGKPVNIDLSNVSEIIEQVGYWRKANQIHKWFVDTVQDGKDNCQNSEVTFEDLMELKKLCEEVLKTKNPNKLPPSSRFFFGSTDINEYYFKDLEDTIKIISALDPDGEYYYRASW